MVKVPRHALYFCGLVGAGAVLYAMPVVNDALGFLAFVSTVPWLLLASDERWSLRTSTLGFLVSVYGAALLFLPWLRSFSTVGWVVAPLFYIPLFLPIVLLTHVMRAAWPRLPFTIIWPIAFTAGEYIRVRLSAGEIPFGQLGASLISFEYFIQTSDLAGVWALTFLATSVGGYLVDCLGLVRNVPHHVPPRGVLALSVALGITITGMAAYGAYQLRSPEFVNGPRVLVLQPNFANWDVTPTMAHDRFVTLVELTRTHAARGRFDLIAWPENSVIPNQPFNEFGRGVEQDRELRTLAAATAATLLIDGPTGRGARRHTAAAIYPDGRVASYDKRLLVPWSECVPYEGLLRRLNDRVAGGFIAFVRSHNPHLQLFAPGEESTIVRVPATRSPTAFAAPICYETLSAPYMRAWAVQARRVGVSQFFVVNPVNEKLLGNSVHATTLAFCRFRAIETRVTVIRAANNGISAAIDPNGRVYAIARGQDGGVVDRPGAMEATVLFDRRFGTIYSRLGDWLPILCLAVSAVAVTRRWLERRSLRSPKRSRVTRTGLWADNRVSSDCR